MTDVAKASSPEDGAAHKTRPEKPDQAKYEADLAAAQEQHEANMEKFVSLPKCGLRLILCNYGMEPSIH